MHLMRRMPVRKDLSGISVLHEGELRVRMDEHHAALPDVKRGEQPRPEVGARAEAPWRLRLHKEFDEASASTRLPERLDYG